MARTALRLRMVMRGGTGRALWEVSVIAISTKHASGPAAPARGTPGAAATDAAFADARFLTQLASWLSTQRWYTGKGRVPRLRTTGRLSLTTTDPSGTGPTSAAVAVLLVLDESGQPVLYQLPLTVYGAPIAALEPALVASLEGDHPLYFYDGPHDPAFARTLLRLILDETAVTGEADAGGQAPAARGRLSLPRQRTEIASSRVFDGEQSNSSIIYELRGDDGTPLSPVVCKIFRTLQHGDNPDVVLLDALGAAGSRVVPRSLGYLGGHWADPAHAEAGRPNGLASGQLAFAQEFFPDVEDAWHLARRAAESGRDFDIAARALGEATAEMHETLARVLGTTPCTPEDIASTMASMRRRVDIAIAEVPALAELRTAIEAAYVRAAGAAWPSMQRIHGDLHLGQVLAVPDRGWVLLDFEGEPLRPMAERNAPDLPLRDVAGMLRSFDYVAGAHALAHPGLSGSDWSLACRRAFIDGYSTRTGHDLLANRVLLGAFEIDKAVYEAIYESRNRPAWLPIPVAAIARLAEHTAD